MEILTGSLYFVSDDFFAKVQDPYLKINYEHTKRPHYFAFIQLFFRVKQIPKIAAIKANGATLTNSHSNA